MCRLTISPGVKLISNRSAFLCLPNTEFHTNDVKKTDHFSLCNSHIDKFLLFCAT